MLSSPSKTKMLILSREIVPFYDSRDVLNKKIVSEMELEGLDFESSIKLLKEKDIDKKMFKKIYGYTDGNPLFLEFFESKDHLERYMHDELFSKLDDDERKILGILSIYRFHVPEESISMNEEYDFKKFYSLTRKSLIKKDSQDRYFLHDLIKKFFYNRLSPSKRKVYHLSAARWFEKRKDPKDYIEAIYHFQEGGEYKKATRVVIKNSITILEGGYSSEFIAVLERFDERNMEADVWLEILIIKGKACYMGGDWKQALLYFTQCSDMATLEGNDPLKIKALCESGHILEEQNEMEKAMDCFNTCLEISISENIPSGMGEAYRGIGRVFWRKEEHKRAITNYRKCLEISEKVCNSELMASAYTDLGNVYEEMNQTEKAIESYNKSLDILKKIKNIYEHARAYHNLALTYEHLEEFHKAIDHYSKQLALAEKLNDLKMLGYGLSSLGICYAKMGNVKKARKYVEKAEKIALKLDNDNIMNIIYKTYGYICKHERRWEEGVSYFNMSLEYLKKLKATYQLPDTYFELGLLYEGMGDFDNAKKHLNSAREFYNDLWPEKAELIRQKLSGY
jgi:tetratricopeptide (TPR) repeat protein